MSKKNKKKSKSKSTAHQARIELQIKGGCRILAKGKASAAVKAKLSNFSNVYTDAGTLYFEILTEVDRYIKLDVQIEGLKEYKKFLEDEAEV